MEYNRMVGTHPPVCGFGSSKLLVLQVLRRTLHDQRGELVLSLAQSLHLIRGICSRAFI